MNLTWQEGLKEIKQRMSLPPAGVLPREPRRKQVRGKKQKAPVGMTDRPFNCLGEMLDKKNQPTPMERPVRIYAVKGETEPVMIQSYYSMDELDRLINRNGLKNLVVRIEAFGGGYYQIDLVKEPLPGGGKAAQRIRLEALGQVVAHAANGLHWKFEEEEDLGYY